MIRLRARDVSPGRRSSNVGSSRLREACGRNLFLMAGGGGHQPALDLALLDRGYHLAFVDVENLYGNETAMARGEELYEILTTQFQLGPKPILEGMSRGGLFIFNFAAKHPDKVTAIYGDNPVCNFLSWPGGINGKLSKVDYDRCLKAYGITVAGAKPIPKLLIQISPENFKEFPLP